MGLFSDTCNAWIDPVTGKALTGDALVNAKKDPKWPRCRNKVSKKARYCKCGQDAPGGWLKCPSCGKWVGNESAYCWNCNHPLYPDGRVDIAGGIWDKSPDQFAQRFEVGSVKRLLTEGIQVQEGTVAILLDGGKETAVLPAGRHTPDGLLRKINWFGNPPPRSFVLVQSGDVVLPIRVEGLRTSEDIPVELYMEVTLAFRPSQADDFLANLLKERRFLSYQNIGEELSGEIRYAANNVCTTSTIEDLVKDPARRDHLNSELSRTISEKLKRIGLELIRVGTTEFLGNEYEDLRKKSGELDLKRREIEWLQEMRELAASEKMHEFKSDQELKEYIAQLAQEKQVSELGRDYELKLLVMVRNNELDRKAAEYMFAAEQEKQAHECQSDDYERDKRLKDKLTDVEIAEYDAKIQRVKNQVEVDKWTEYIRIVAEIKKIENETRRGKAEVKRGMTPLEMAGVADDPEERRDFLELAKLEHQKAMSPVQILATLSGVSHEAAQALSAMTATEKQEAERLIQEYRQMANQGLERDERLLTQVVAMMTEAAKRTEPPVQNQQIIK